MTSNNFTGRAERIQEKQETNVYAQTMHIKTLWKATFSLLKTFEVLALQKMFRDFFYSILQQQKRFYKSKEFHKNKDYFLVLSMLFAF
jgi:hypothetical protein